METPDDIDMDDHTPSKQEFVDIGTAVLTLLILLGALAAVVGPEVVAAVVCVGLLWFLSRAIRW